MSNTAKKDGVVVLGEHEFNRVKNGLDEVQVASFIDELIKERDKLAQSQEHIVSLNRLAEMTVIEADRLATQIKTKAAEQAKAESTSIIGKAEEQARQMMEKRIAEAVEIADKKADAIKTKAEEEAVLLLDSERSRIRGELRNLVNQQFGYMLEELEGLRQRAQAVQADFGNKLSATGEDNGAAAAEIIEKGDTLVAEEKDAAAAEIIEKGDTLVAEEKDTAAAEIAEERDILVAEEKDVPATEIGEERDTLVAEEKDAVRAEIIEERDTSVAKEGKSLDKQPAPSRAEDHNEKGLDLLKLLEIEDQADLSKPQWEVEISPPFDIAKIMEVVSFLDQLPQVANTEMIVPQIDMPSILVFLRESMNFVDVLQTIPAVAHVEEITTDKAATSGEPGKGPRKVRISLSGNTTSQKNK